MLKWPTPPRLAVLPSLKDTAKATITDEMGTHLIYYFYCLLIFYNIYLFTCIQCNSYCKNKYKRIALQQRFVKAAWFIYKLLCQHEKRKGTVANHIILDVVQLNRVYLSGDMFQYMTTSCYLRRHNHSVFQKLNSISQCWWKHKTKFK